MLSLRTWVGLILALTLLPILIIAGSRVIALFSHAAAIPANIIIDASKSQANLDRPWQGLSQGGESEPDGTLVSLGPTVGSVKNLGINYVRIDHVFDRPYQSRIKEIIDSGAVPFISLSYFPSDVSDKDIGTVRNWAAWQTKVRTLVENVSGRNQLNQQNVYYEVWNEPDGASFGGFKTDYYFELYTKTVEAAQSAQNVNSFKIGGPALADLRRCTNGLLFVCESYWLDNFLDSVAQNRTRLDFISWHRYSLNISDYNEDVNFITSHYTAHNTLPPAEKIITEWGSVPERSPLHTSLLDAAHLVAAARSFVGYVNLATKFEVRDGPDSGDKGWGLYYYNGSPKPTVAALALLNLLRPERILLSGEGSNVTGLASRDSSGVTFILVNYDSRGLNTEQVPIKVISLTPGRYRVTKHLQNTAHPLSISEVNNFTTSDGTFIASEIMPPNSLVLYDLQLISLPNLAP